MAKPIIRRDKLRKILREFRLGKLKSGSGHKVVKKSQAMAIALSESRKK
jgi:predicted PP-loop superfamily ATPase